VLLIIPTYFAEWLIFHKNRLNSCFLKFLELSTEVADVERHKKYVLCLLAIRAWQSRGRCWSCPDGRFGVQI
jgi:hypothetical protein